MTDDRDRLRDAVSDREQLVQRLVDVVRLHVSTGLLGKDGPAAKALAALDAHTAQRATAETVVQLAVWQVHHGESNGLVVLSPTHLALDEATRLGTTTLRLDTEAAG